MMILGKLPYIRDENDHILGIYRMYWGTMEPDKDFGKLPFFRYLLVVLGYSGT